MYPKMFHQHLHLYSTKLEFIERIIKHHTNFYNNIPAQLESASHFLVVRLTHMKYKKSTLTSKTVHVLFLYFTFVLFVHLTHPAY